MDTAEVCGIHQMEKVPIGFEGASTPWHGGFDTLPRKTVRLAESNKIAAIRVIGCIGQKRECDVLQCGADGHRSPYEFTSVFC